MQYKQVGVISGKGPGADQFAAALRGVAVDGAGLVYAVGDNCVKVFDRSGELLRQFRTGTPGYCVSVDEAGVTYVGQAGQMEIFDTTGKRLTVWEDAERLGLVTAIGFHGENVLLADAQDRCIRRYDRQGKWLSDIGRDNNTKGFLIPNGHLDFSVDADGVIHAANPAKFRIERYSLAGDLLGKFGKWGMHRIENFQGCCNPTNVTLTNDGHVVVTEKAGPRMKVFDTDGRMLAYVDAGAFDANCKNMDVAADSRGLIYVVDTVRLHILVFAPDGANGSATSESPTEQSEVTP